LLSSRSFFFPWLSSSCLASVLFKVYQKWDRRITSLMEVRHKGRNEQEGLCSAQ
jgi:hypothetical protein